MEGKHINAGKLFFSDGRTKELHMPHPPRADNASGQHQTQLRRRVDKPAEKENIVCAGIQKKKKKNYVGVGTKDVCSRLMRNSLQFSRPSWAHLGDVIHSISSAQIAFWLCNYCVCHGQNSIGNPPTIYSLL